jgi:hypothetical protein
LISFSRDFVCSLLICNYYALMSARELQLILRQANVLMHNRFRLAQLHRHKRNQPAFRYVSGRPVRNNASRGKMPRTAFPFFLGFDFNPEIRLTLLFCGPGPAIELLS